MYMYALVGITHLNSYHFFSSTGVVPGQEREMVKRCEDSHCFGKRITFRAGVLRKKKINAHCNVLIEADQDHLYNDYH